jgi:hypothetical protein
MIKYTFTDKRGKDYPYKKILKMKTFEEFESWRD